MSDISDVAGAEVGRKVAEREAELGYKTIRPPTQIGSLKNMYVKMGERALRLSERVEPLDDYGITDEVKWVIGKYTSLGYATNDGKRITTTNQSDIDMSVENNGTEKLRFNTTLTMNAGWYQGPTSQAPVSMEGEINLVPTPQNSREPSYTIRVTQFGRGVFVVEDIQVNGTPKRRPTLFASFFKERQQNYDA